MNIRPLESLTKEELIELIKHERDHSEQPLTMVPEGFKLVPIEPTAEMKKAGCQVPLNKAARHNACYKAMLAAAPQPDHIPDDGRMIEPTDTQMLDWLIKNDALICHSATSNLYEIWFGIDNVETGKSAREAIINAMRGES